MRAFLAGLLLLAACSAAPPPPTTGPIIVASYGAVCNDIADDTAAFTQAVSAWQQRTNLVGHGAEFVIPPGICRVSQPLNFVPPDGGFVSGVIRGSGQGLSAIRYLGSGTAVTFSRFKYGEISGFSLLGSGANGGQTGMLLTNTVDGMGSNGDRLAELTISGFTTGLQFGQGNRAAAEIAIENTTVSNSATCVKAESYNTLDLVFQRLNLADCAVGVDTRTAHQFVFLGGAGSNNQETFRFWTAGTLTITGWRDELPPNGGTYWLSAGCCAAPAQVTIRDTTLLGSSAPNLQAVVGGGNVFFEISNSYLLGSVLPVLSGGGLIMTNTAVVASEAWRPRYPTSSWGHGIYVHAEGNWKPASAGDSSMTGWWPDAEGYYGIDGAPR